MSGLPGFALKGALPLLCLGLAACAEIDLREDGQGGTAPAQTAAAADGTPLYYKYGERGGSPDAPVDPDRAVNDYRAAHELPRLSRTPQLVAAAEAHASDMARTGTVGHVGSDGSSILDRVRAQGYDAARVAENAGWTARGFATVLEGWDESPSHRKTLRLREVTDYGIGRSGQ
ncbi:CAP domain-containing protein [Salipiger abyssi]|uniref:CAP domain-containing protein n=1 Tax=Salipiger abyssi TaxID=1250539 RepID=UPI0040584D3A